MDRFARITQAWAGRTVVCLGSGPSATEEVIAKLARAALPTIAVNDMYLVAPWATVCYFADTRWWDWHHNGKVSKAFPWAKFSEAQVREAFAAYAGQKVSIENTGAMISDANVFLMHNYGYEGLSDRPNGLHTGSNSGYQAINIAYLAGAKRIILAGYDLRFPGGRSHAHDGHRVAVGEDRYHQYARTYATMLPQLAKAGVEVVQTTLDSAVRCFPMRSLDEALACA